MNATLTVSSILPFLSVMSSLAAPSRVIGYIGCSLPPRFDQSPDTLELSHDTQLCLETSRNRDKREKKNAARLQMGYSSQGTRLKTPTCDVQNVYFCRYVSKVCATAFVHEICAQKSDKSPRGVSVDHLARSEGVPYPLKSF